MPHGWLAFNGRCPSRVGAISFVAGATLAIAALVAPGLARADAPGSLAQLTSPNDCIVASVDSSECQTVGTGLSGSTDAVVSPDGKNVYVIGNSDDAVAEFSRDAANGLVAPLGCIVEPGTEGTCDGGGVTGLQNPQAIVISPNGQNVYVAAQDGVGDGDVVELTRDGSDGSLTPIAGHDCIAENIEFTDETSPCNDQSGHGIRETITDLAVSPDGSQVYAVNEAGKDIAMFARARDGSLTQPNQAGDCIEDLSVESNDCSQTATGLVVPTGVAVSPDGKNVYTVGRDDNSGQDGAIAEFTRDTSGTLAQADSSDCVQTGADDLGCAVTAVGIAGTSRLIVSPDGRNVYTASEALAGPIAEFSRDSSGALAQLAAPNDCI